MGEWLDGLVGGCEEGREGGEGVGWTACRHEGACVQVGGWVGWLVGFNYVNYCHSYHTEDITPHQAIRSEKHTTAEQQKRGKEKTKVLEEEDEEDVKGKGNIW